MRVTQLRVLLVDDDPLVRTSAGGFLLKEGSPQEIIDAVRVVAAGELLLSPHTTRKLVGHLSEATVKTHITRTFAKLDVSNRVQLTIFAYEAGLVSA